MRYPSLWLFGHNVKHGNWWGVLDTIGHFLHLPKFIQHPICDRYDRSVGSVGVQPYTSSSTTNVDVTWSEKP